MNINTEMANTLERILEIFPPETPDKFWWPDGLQEVITKADELLNQTINQNL